MKRALLRSLGRRALALCLLLIAVGSARASCAAEDRPLKHSILELDLPIGQPSDRVIVRTDGDATEFDLFFPDGRTLSFVAVFGAGKRAVCEGIYVDERSWTLYCETYDVQFESFHELIDGVRGCPSCTVRHRYAVGAGSEHCPAARLGERVAGGADDDLVLQAVAELATWDDGSVDALKRAFRDIGGAGCPRLCTPLVPALGVRDPGTLTELTEEDAAALQSIPDDLRARLDYNQLRGLGAWMEEHVADLP